MSRTEIIDHKEQLEHALLNNETRSPKWVLKLCAEIRRIEAFLVTMDEVFGTNWRIEIL